MPKLNYPLKKYVKAVSAIAKKNGFERVEHFPTKGSIVRFELFRIDQEVPTAFWVVHHNHSRKKEIWSKEDYKKAAMRLNCSVDELISSIQSV